jgi:hypothetical protein
MSALQQLVGRDYWRAEIRTFIIRFPAREYARPTKPNHG